MTTYDLHAHLVDLDAVAEMQRECAELAPHLENRDGRSRLAIHERGYQALPPGLCDPQKRLSDMDRGGIDVQAVMVAPALLHYHIDAEVAAAYARISNDAFIDHCERFPDRFVALANLPLQDADLSIEEIERIQGSRHVRGIGAGSTVAGVDLDAEYLEPVWAALEAADLPVWIHPDYRSAMGGERINQYFLQNGIGNPLETTIAIGKIIHSGLLDRHPRLRFGFCHGGGFAPYQVRRWDVGWERVSAASEHIPESPPSSFFEKMYFDSLTFDMASLRLLAEYVGWQHIVVGSDYPMLMFTEQPLADIQKMRLPQETERQVREQSAEHFLRRI